MARHVVLPAAGTVLVSADLHGNGGDFDRLRAGFERGPSDRHWVILGDIVHGPNDIARRRRPDLYDYDDESGRIALEILALKERYPGRVHFVLGNHDWAHIGGPVTAKFWPNEASYLESWAEPAAVAAMRSLFVSALLCVIAPCGALLCHASPGRAPTSLEELDGIELGEALAPRQHRIVEEFTGPYEQTEADCRRFLHAMSQLCGHKLTMVIHGHDRHESGWIVRNDTQASPVLFGAPRSHRRIIVLDLDTHYGSVRDLREGHDVVHLWGGR